MMSMCISLLTVVISLNYTMELQHSIPMNSCKCSKRLRITVFLVDKYVTRRGSVVWSIMKMLQKHKKTVI